MTPCECFKPAHSDSSWAELQIHDDQQDKECDGWKRLLDLIEVAATDGREMFAPGKEMEHEDWMDVVTLPPSISKLNEVKHLMLYGSNLMRIPPEIGEMESLREFTPYTSYRLHWFPYEITRCAKLRESTVSTRAVYGNYKYRFPFPNLKRTDLSTQLCSVCGVGFEPERRVRRFWISLHVATDVLPLFVCACSDECVESLPTPPENYVDHPHRGSLGLAQPPKGY